MPGQHSLFINAPLKRKTYIALCLICLLGFALRVYHLAGPSLWIDEIMTAGRIDFSLSQLIEKLPSYPFPPFYYVFMNLWSKIFKICEFSLRFPSVIFSALSILFIYKLAKEFFDKNTGIISALLLSVSPYSINYAQDAKMYSMLWFFAIGSFYYWFRFIKSGGVRILIGYVFFTSLSIYTNYSAFLFIITQNIIFCFFGNKQHGKKWILGQLSIFLLYLPWLPFFLFSAIHRTGIYWVHPVKSYVMRFSAIFGLLSGTAIGKTNFLEFVTYFFLTSSVFISIKKRENSRLPLLKLTITESQKILLFLICLPILIMLLGDLLHYPVFVLRYFGFIHIPLIILVSASIQRFTPKVKLLLIIFLLFFMFSNHLILYYRDNLKFPREDWKRLFKEMSLKMPPQSALFFFPYHQDMAELFIKGSGVYNFGQSMQVVKGENEIIEKSAKAGSGSIFILYEYQKNEIREIPGYELKEHYRIDRWSPDRGNKNTDRFIGFSWFKKMGKID